jgi:CheY-like chemotaxis protein
VEHKILVIDDDEDLRESLIAYLEDHGYATAGAVNGKDALDMLSDLSERPSVIVLDLMMPIMDGRMFREAQLMSPKLGSIPVILISAYDNSAEVAQELNIDAHLSKPIDPDDFLRLVRDLAGHAYYRC